MAQEAQDLQKSTKLVHRAFCLHGRGLTKMASVGYMTTIISGSFDMINFVAFVPLPLFSLLT